MEQRSSFEARVMITTMEVIVLFRYYTNLTYNFSISPFESPSSGPDVNDNFWTDSDNETSIPYNWIDISEIGSLYSFSNNDAAGSTIDIGFDFEFYGQNYSILSI